jgi:hypothetical protein
MPIRVADVSVIPKQKTRQATRAMSDHTIVSAQLPEGFSRLELAESPAAIVVGALASKGG